MNPQRDRGIRAEREACVLLGGLLGLDVHRRKNEGIPEDIGDLIGVPDTAIQISAVPCRHLAVAQRARTKIVDCAIQQARLGARHGVVLMRIDGNNQRPPAWRALVDVDQFAALDAGSVIPNPRTTLGQIIIEADRWELASFYSNCIIVCSLATWAATWNALHATEVRT